MNKHLSLQSIVLLAARRTGLRAGSDNAFDVLVRVQAPDAVPGEVTARPSQSLALVIDRSGSMSGRPLAEARRCAAFVVSRLRPTDSASVLQFDNRVEVLWPSAPVGNGEGVRGAIDRIREGGNTNLHGGWLDGARTLADVPGSGLKRVILLSDGCANEGVTDAAYITAECGAWATKGITTSTYGLGANFNEDLMVSIAETGGGNNYYGDTADDLMEPFQKELDLLANLAMRNVEITCSAPDGIQVEMLNDLPVAGAGWRLPDLAWGSEAWALFRVTVPVTSLPRSGERLVVLRVAVTGNTLKDEAVNLERVGLALPVLSQAAFDALPEDELVVRRSLEVEAAGTLTRMRAAAQNGDWITVDRMLEEAGVRFAGNEWVARVLSAMTSIAQGRSRERMSKELRYSRRISACGSRTRVN